MAGDKPHAGVDRSLALGNRLLKECRAHVRRTQDFASVLLGITYVHAEFIAAASLDEAAIDEGIAIAVEQIKARAMERLEEMNAARAARRKGMN
jgi:hypothetical protein